MNSQLDSGAPGGFFAAAAAYGVPAPRPRLLLVLLTLIAAAILLSTALDLYFTTAKIEHMMSMGKLGGGMVKTGTLRAGEITGTLFTSSMMAAMLALMAFGYNWARWVWLIVCVLLGGLAALVSLFVTFGFSAELGFAKCALYAIFFLSACMLFAPSNNAWFRLIKSLRKQPLAQQQQQAHDPYTPPAAHAPTPLVLAPRPRTLNLGIALCFCAALAGSILSAFNMPALLASQGLDGDAGMMKTIMYASMALGAVLMLVMMYFIARGSAVVRWIWLALAVFGALSSLSTLTALFPISMVYAICAGANQVLMLIGTALMFAPASNQWMRAAALARRP